ncbi:clavesin-2 [Caerostris extrusa]|uniref:Clavesin-2 n=1 Tax=Caerostris extrusa TaxID=172846 RepID=A0AAV4TTV6_CAEEX|nr:clavesin-2 [Caerostris extrusa]
MKNNSFLFIGLAGIVDHSKYSYMERFYSELLAMNKLVDNPINQIYGATLLIDYTGFNIHSILATTPGNALLFVETLLSMFPIRNKECHIVNAPSIFTSFFKIFYPLLPKKIQNRIFVHPNNDNWKSLHAHIPAEILPEEYGGELRHESLLRALENFEELDEQFLEKFAYGHKNTQHRRKNLRVITVEDKK